MRPGAAVTVRDLEGADAATVLARLRADEPVAWLPALGVWLVTRHDLAVTVLRDAATFTVDDPRFSTAQVVGPSMLSLDGDGHRRHRTPFGPPFRAAQIEARFLGVVEALTADLVERIRPAGRADLRATVAGPLAVAVIAHSLGLRNVDAARVLGWYSTIVAAVTALTAGRDAEPTAAEAMSELATAVRAGLEDRGSPLFEQARATLTDPEIVSNAAVMMFGGIETTDGMISNALVHLLGDHAVATAARADPGLVPAVIEESLRLEPAAAVVDRYATRATRLAGVAISAGAPVRVSLAGANRDPAVFTDPDVFDPYRADVRSQLAFARGPHACVAMDLARLEARVAVTTVLRRLPGLHLTAPAPATGLVFRKPHRVAAAWRAG